MRIIEVIPARRWINHRNGCTASIYGAVPYTNEQDKQFWAIETIGWTVRKDDGTVGTGRRPFLTKAEADAFMATHNARVDALEAGRDTCRFCWGELRYHYDSKGQWESCA